jgi:hypothetical protein
VSRRWKGINGKLTWTEGLNAIDPKLVAPPPPPC